MFLIGIETSGLTGSVAIARDEKCLDCRSLDQPGRRHAQSLVLEIQQMLAASGITPRQVDAVAVSRGPGSFTGLRVGLVCAKTFAYATGCRYVAVDTFATVAMNCPADIHDLWIAEDAQRGELIVGRYLRSGDGWRLANPVCIVDAESWLANRQPDQVITGRGLLRYDVTSFPGHYLIDENVIHPVASCVIQLGMQLLSHPEAARPEDFDCWKSTPFYMRPSAAEETRDKQSAATG